MTQRQLRKALHLHRHGLSVYDQRPGVAQQDPVRFPQGGGDDCLGAAGSVLQHVEGEPCRRGWALPRHPDLLPVPRRRKRHTAQVAPPGAVGVERMAAGLRKSLSSQVEQQRLIGRLGGRSGTSPSGPSKVRVPDGRTWAMVCSEYKAQRLVVLSVSPGRTQQSLG